MMNKVNVQQAKDILEEIRSTSRTQHIKFNPSEMTIDFMENEGDSPNRFKPSNTGLKFHQAPDFFKGIKGPFGSGKSSDCMANIVMRTCMMPKCKDGVRRAKWAIIRNTLPELESSTIPTWKFWYSKLGKVKERQKPVYTLHHQFNDGKGPIELGVWFIPCDKPRQVKKFKSTEFTGVYLNEANELPYNLLDMAVGRINRYPPKKLCPDKYDSGIIFDANPPDTDHWFYDLFENRQPEGYRLFNQPPGLIKDEEGNWQRNPEADNIDNLPDDYYQKMAQSGNEEFIKVYCLGQYGLVRHGKPVFPQYNDDLHAVDDIEIEKGELLLFGLDFGLSPAFLIAQCVNGQMRFIKEFCADNCSAAEFAPVVKSWLNVHAPELAYQADYDPSDRAADSDNTKASQIWADNGIVCEPAITNNPLERLDAVKYYLTKLIEGQPAYLISKTGCPVLRKGMLGDYHYKRVAILGEEKFKDMPNKTHPISDVQDCAQYICLRQQHHFIPNPKPDSQVFDYSHFM